MATQRPAGGHGPGYVLPSGWHEVEGAFAAGGWILNWNGRDVFAWTPSAPPYELPRATAPIRAAVAAPRGGGVLVNAGDQLGYWPFAGTRWSWWHVLDGSDFELMTCVGDLVLLVQVEEGGSQLDLLDPEERGPSFRARGHAAGIDSPLAAWRDTPTGDVVVLGTEGRCRWSNPLRGRVMAVVEAEHPPPEQTLCAIEVLPEGGVILHPRFGNGPAQRYDPATGTFELLPLAHLPGCRPLWEAWSAGDRASARKIVDLYRAALPPSTVTGRPDVFDLLMNGGDPVAAATSAGIRVAGQPAVHGMSEHVRRLHVQLTSGLACDTWELWVDREASLRDAVRGLLRSVHQNEALALAGAILVPGVDAAIREFLAELDALWTDERAVWSPEGIRAVCLRAGRAIVPCVERALEAASPAAQWFALAAAGTTEGGDWESSPRSALWDDPGATLTKPLSAFVSHPERRLCKTALESAAAIRLGGLADVAGTILDSSDSALRSAAADALRNLPGPSVSTIEKLRVTALEDENELVRRHALRAFAGAEEWTSARETLLRAVSSASWVDRSEAYGLIASYAADPRFRLLDALEAGDVEWVTRTALPQSEAEPTWYLRHDEFWTEIGRSFEIRVPGDVAALTADRRELLVGSAIVMLYESLASGAEDEFLEEEELEVFELMLADQEGWRAPLEMDDLRALCGRQIRPLVLGQMALEALERLPAVGARLAQLAQIRLGTWSERFGGGDGPDAAPGQDVPLHQRLRRMGRPHPVAVAVRSFVEARSRDPGRDGVLALYCLSRGGDGEAAARLRQVLAEGGVQGIGFVVSAFLFQLSEVERLPFVDQILAREALAPWERHGYEWLRDQLGLQ